MSLSEIHAANAAAANATTGAGTGTGAESPSRHEDAANESHQGRSNEAPFSPNNSERESEGWPFAEQDERESVEGELVERGKDFEGEEGDGGGAGGRARQRLKAGGRRIKAGQGREADLSVRYLITKVKTPHTSP